MLPDERMVKAAERMDAMTHGAEPLRSDRPMRTVLEAAFAALDRDALIEVGAKALLARTPATPNAYSEKGTAETILRAVGLIPADALSEERQS